jgi:hypothetical protein
MPQPRSAAALCFRVEAVHESCIPASDSGPRPAMPDAPRAPATIPREQDAPLSLILLMIAVMLLLVGAGFYWADHSDMAEHVLGQPTQAGGSDPILDLDEILGERVGRNLVGRDVSLWDVRVAHVPGDYVFWIAGDGRQVPVVLLGEQTGRQGEHEKQIRTGDRVAIFGTMRSIREVQLLDERWAMSRAEWDRLAREQIYISALRVEQLDR